MGPRNTLLLACALAPISATQGASILILADTATVYATPGHSVSLNIQASNLEQTPAPGLLSMRVALSIDADAAATADQVSIAAAGPAASSLFPNSPPLSMEAPNGFTVNVATLPPSPPATLPGDGVVDLFSLELSVGPMAAGEYQLVLLPFVPTDPASPGFLALGAPPIIAPFANLPTPPHTPNSLLATIVVVPEPASTTLLVGSAFATLTGLRRHGGRYL